MSGYVRAQRARFGHPLFAREKFCRGYAWDWLVAHAAFRDYRVSIRGVLVTIRRGQLTHSVRHLGEVWNWDKAAVSRFLARLKTETMIETCAETGQLIITICNYEKYQADSPHPDTANGTAPETPARQQRDSSETIEKEGKEGKEKKEARAAAPVPISQPFEVPDRTADQDRFPEFWAAYPKREGQVQAEAAFITAAIKVDAAEIIAKARLYAKSRQGEDPRYTLAPAKWLTDKRWTDEYAPPKADDAASKKRAAWSRMAAGFDTPNARRSA